MSGLSYKCANPNPRFSEFQPDISNPTSFTTRLQANLFYCNRNSTPVNLSLYKNALRWAFNTEASLHLSNCRVSMPLRAFS